MLNVSNVKLTKNGAVSFNYEKKCYFEIENDKSTDIEQLQLDIIDQNVNDVEADTDEDTIYIKSDDINFGKIQCYLDQKNINIKEAGLIYESRNSVTLPQKEEEMAINLITNLEDLDDVKSVYHNIEFSQK